MKILIVGLGSIGRKHFSILKKMGDIDVATLRSRKGTQKNELDIKEYYDLKDALSFKADGVIVSNPTSLHVKDALPFLENGAKVLIEKPISNSIESLNKLELHTESVRVAYCFRFLKLYNRLKALFEKEQPFLISFKRSFFLPHWHPNSDYKSEYVAREELGGGVLRTLSHEIDLAIHWFGSPLEVIGLSEKLGFLEMNTDDFAWFSMKMKNKCRINFQLDLYSPSNINEGEAFTEKGKYTWDMSGVYFSEYQSKNTKTVFINSEDSLDQMYFNQLIDFNNFIKSGQSSACNYYEAVESLKVIEKIS